jgi:membrane-bound lytic murein transglycosylase B
VDVTAGARVIGRVGLAIGLVVSLVAGVLTAPRTARAGRDRGYGFLVEKLAQDGYPRDRALAVFRDDRIDDFDGLYFSLAPRESSRLYRGLRTRATAGRARLCLDAHAAAFAQAEERYGVPGSLVAALIQVESGCGRNTGSSRIVPALARLAMAAEPSNLQQNIDRHTLLASAPRRDVEALTRWRASYLEDLFYPELKTALEIADHGRFDPLDLRGSGAGAFGIPQFLPRSYRWFGVDGNGDKQVSLYEPADAIASAARYLQHYGWRSGLSRREQRNVIWGYNRSDAYIDTVLWLQDEIVSPTPEPTVRAKAKPRTRVASARGTKKTRRR